MQTFHDDYDGDVTVVVVVMMMVVITATIIYSH